MLLVLQDKVTQVVLVLQEAMYLVVEVEELLNQETQMVLVMVEMD